MFLSSSEITKKWPSKRIENAVKKHLKTSYFQKLHRNQLQINCTRWLIRWGTSDTSTGADRYVTTSIYIDV